MNRLGLLCIYDILQYKMLVAITQETERSSSRRQSRLSEAPDVLPLTPQHHESRLQISDPKSKLPPDDMTLDDLSSLIAPRGRRRHPPPDLLRPNDIRSCPRSDCRGTGLERIRHPSLGAAQ